MDRDVRQWVCWSRAGESDGGGVGVSVDRDGGSGCVGVERARRMEAGSWRRRQRRGLWVLSLLSHAPGLLLEFGDPHVAIICARDFFSADSSEFDEGVEGATIGDGALCVGASSVDDIVDTSSRINPPSDAMSEFEVKFVVRAAIRLERECLCGI